LAGSESTEIPWEPLHYAKKHSCEAVGKHKTIDLQVYEKFDNLIKRRVLFRTRFKSRHKTCMATAARKYWQCNGCHVFQWINTSGAEVMVRRQWSELGENERFFSTLEMGASLRWFYPRCSFIPWTWSLQKISVVSSTVFVH